MRLTTSIVAGWLFAIGAAETRGQVLSGHVLELGSDRPIVGAAVGAIVQGRSVLTAQSDSAGFFRIVLPEAGWYRVRVDRLGYAPAASDSLEIGQGEVVEVGIQLRVAAVELPPVMVVTSRHVVPSMEFYRRMDAGRRTGNGYFVTRQELDSTRVVSLTGLLSRVPQVGMVYDRRGMARPVMLSHGGCRPTLYLNGGPVNLSAGEALDDLFQLQALEGIEIYRNRAELPMEVSAPRECGAIFLWARPGDHTSGSLWRILAGGAALVVGIVLFRAM